MATAAPTAASRPDLDQPTRLLSMIVCIVLLIGITYIGYQLVGDLAEAKSQSWLPFLLLFVALLIALGFEFVNGFHDTANAVATVIYTHAMPAQLAVVWSGCFNFLGVLLSSGLVAFSIVSLLPVELILKVGSAAGFAMVFALLIAAIIWNLGTWYLGLPSSSSHTLIGSIIGVGLMNQLMHRGSAGTSGVDWGQATTVGEALLFSPVVGFIGAALLLLAMKLVFRQPQLYSEPKGAAPPPLWIRSLLIFTCTAVSFAHGSNDGQKGMGLIMLILIGTVPTAYALNRAVDEGRVPAFIEASDRAVAVLDAMAPGAPPPADPSQVLEHFVGTRQFTREVVPALAAVARHIAEEVRTFGSLAKVPTDLVKNVRNEMYLASETLRVGRKYEFAPFTGDGAAALSAYEAQLDDATRFIPTWVKVAVALALGLGTMVGWKRIVITVGERIGKRHLTYGQGAAAELVAAGTIGLADLYGLPVSTTHVLSSGVAGTMAANGSGLQWGTVRNLLAAWLMTLPASIALAAALYWLLNMLFGGA
jgi:PiT family inorganic phosphate transporter